MSHDDCKWRGFCARCNASAKPASGKQVALSLDLRKGALRKKRNGNWIVEVEASNENLDLEGQRVLQSALLKSKDYFLHNGVVSKDHYHKDKDEYGNTIFREEYVIGEPLEVVKEPDKTVVRLELYKDNPYAQEFAKLLESNSSRVKASVGGTVLEKEDGEDGEDIKTVLWDDLALTIAPVNPTLSGATLLRKSLGSGEFVKALSAGCGTDAAQFEGGRALQGGDDEKAIVKLMEQVKKGAIANYDDAVYNLVDSGILEDDIPYVLEEMNRDKEIAAFLRGRVS
jgi:hypothetical protein